MYICRHPHISRMLFVLLSWACLALALALAWLWLQSRTYLQPMHPTAQSQLDSDRLVHLSVASLLLLAGVLLLLHFLVPRVEQGADAEWAALANLTLPDGPGNASGPYMYI